jgi:hypothetical protein
MDTLPIDVLRSITMHSIDKKMGLFCRNLVLVNRFFRGVVFDIVQMLPPQSSTRLMIALSNLSAYAWVPHNPFFAVSCHDFQFYNAPSTVSWWGGSFQLSDALYPLIVTQGVDLPPQLALASFKRIIRTSVWIVCLDTSTYTSELSDHLDEVLNFWGVGAARHCPTASVLERGHVCLHVAVNRLLWYDYLSPLKISCATHAADVAVVMVHDRCSDDTVYRKHTVLGIKQRADHIRHIHCSCCNNNTHNVPVHHPQVLRRSISMVGTACFVHVHVPHVGDVNYEIEANKARAMFNFIPDNVNVDTMDLHVFWERIIKKWGKGCSLMHN